MHISANSCTQTYRHTDTTTDTTTNLIISFNSLRSIGGDNNVAAARARLALGLRTDFVLLMCFIQTLCRNCPMNPSVHVQEFAVILIVVDHSLWSVDHVGASDGCWVTCIGHVTQHQVDAG